MKAWLYSLLFLSLVIAAFWITHLQYGTLINYLCILFIVIFAVPVITLWHLVIWIIYRFNIPGKSYRNYIVHIPTLLITLALTLVFPWEMETSTFKALCGCSPPWSVRNMTYYDNGGFKEETVGLSFDISPNDLTSILRATGLSRVSDPIKEANIDEEASDFITSTLNSPKEYYLIEKAYHSEFKGKDYTETSQTFFIVNAEHTQVIAALIWQD